MKNLSADIQGFLAKHKPQQAVFIDEPSPKLVNFVSSAKDKEQSDHKEMLILQ